MKEWVAVFAAAGLIVLFLVGVFEMIRKGLL